MNDTINILENPGELCYQHPALYVWYTYFFYRVGIILGNSNTGLALLSFVQILVMDYVITYAITLLYRKGVARWFCIFLACYFAFAPLFSTYAVSAIKDTPFSIALFYFIVLLWELADSKGELFSEPLFCLKCIISVAVITGFRSNGLPVMIGSFIILFLYYRKYRKSVIVSILLPIVLTWLLGRCFMPTGGETLFQERIGIPLQQVSAVVAKGGELTVEQEAYLYRLLPEEEWKTYAPSCADIIKWNDKFDRKYLNETKREFLQIWMELLPENLQTYVEAYLMSTYGIWGIETRNSEQYYVKDIFQNELGLYQSSPLPGVVQTFFYRFYCNRFTYRYLSAGTAFWVLSIVCLFLMSQKNYRFVIAFSPIWLCFLTLMVSAPIAFAFRYVFYMAMLFPFLLFIPFLYNTESM